MKGDLHMHSFCSDGDLSPTALADRCKALGYGAAVLTDHDSVAGVAEFRAACEARGILATAGVELSCFYDDEIHILGYGPSLTGAEPLRDAIARSQAARKARFGRIRAKLAALGHPLTDAEIGPVPEGSITRRHLAVALWRRGDVASIQDAYAHFLGRGKPAWEPVCGLRPEEAVDAIVASGGLAVLAHPGRCTLPHESVERLVARLVDRGLGGIESFYAAHTTDTVRWCGTIAARFGLVETNGSDFHRDDDIDSLHGSHYDCSDIADATIRAVFRE